MKWNFGAFGLTWLWLMFHNKSTIGFVVLFYGLALRFVATPSTITWAVLYLPLIAYEVWLGVAGHRIAWDNRRYSDLDEYFTVETAWKNWVFVAYGLIALFDHGKI